MSAETLTSDQTSVIKIPHVEHINAGWRNELAGVFLLGGLFSLAYGVCEIGSSSYASYFSENQIRDTVNDPRDLLAIGVAAGLLIITSLIHHKEIKHAESVASEHEYYRFDRTLSDMGLRSNLPPLPRNLYVLSAAEEAPDNSSK